ncbi:MAG: hypothetical protein OXT67_04595 [Zetaproteobacteria bacterium]|nr:hypothetical protein [Zetaproteobacteria bacterium]
MSDSSPSLDQYAMILGDKIKLIDFVSTLLRQHDDSFVLESHHLDTLAHLIGELSLFWSALNQVFQVGELSSEMAEDPKVKAYVVYLRTRLEHAAKD